VKLQPLEPPVLVSEAARVRPLREDDAPHYAAAFRDDPRLGLMAGFETDPDEDSLRRKVPEIAEHARLGSWAQLAITAPEEDRFLGDLILHHVDWRRQEAEIGFWLAPGARGRGLATSAVRLLLGWTLHETSLHRIVMRTLPENAPTLALAERLGFTREGLIREYAIERGQRVSLEQWSLLASDPAAERL
jgi:RimJ/RimL family protein N-acetyltransferase